MKDKTYDDITISILKYCVAHEDTKDCNDCPWVDKCSDDVVYSEKKALEIIEKRSQKIEKLERITSEPIKEFWGNVKNFISEVISFAGYEDETDLLQYGDNLVKEMTE